MEIDRGEQYSQGQAEASKNIPESGVLVDDHGMPMVKTRGDVSTLISLLGSRYDIEPFMFPGSEIRPDFPTALALTYAVEDTANKNGGWTQGDVLVGHAATLALLKTASFEETAPQVEAILNGATGNPKEITNRIVGPGAPRGVRFIVQTMVASNQLSNLASVAAVIKDERKLEKSLTELARIQRDFILDPARMDALTRSLNGRIEFVKPPSKNELLIPKDAFISLARLSPFSLEDMKTLDRYFNAIERNVNAPMRIRTQQIEIETFLHGVQAAGVNTGRIASRATAGATSAVLLTTGGAIGGVVGGVALFATEFANQVKNAIEAAELRRKSQE